MFYMMLSAMLSGGYYTYYVRTDRNKLRGTIRRGDVQFFSELTFDVEHCHHNKFVRDLY